MQHRFAASVVATFGFIAGAHAQPAPTVDTDPLSAAAALLAPALPPVGSWSLGVRFPWDVTTGGGHTGVGLGGIGLDVDNRVSDRGFMGASADAEAVMNLGPADSTGSMVQTIVRLRAAVDARYVFHGGTSTIEPHCAPSFDVPRRDWIGLRAGVETVDQAASVGEFAELSLGMDRQLGRTQVGPYISVTQSYEPSSGQATAFTLGLHLIPG